MAEMYKCPKCKVTSHSDDWKEGVSYPDGIETITFMCPYCKREMKLESVTVVY